MIKKLLVLILVGVAVVTLQGSSCRGLVKPTPTQSEIDKVHADAKRIGDTVVVIESVVDQIGKFADALPLSTAEKNAYDCLVVKANGTSTPQPSLIPICGPTTPQGPGPVPIALGHLKTAQTEVGLSTTVREITSVVQPLLDKAMASTNSFIKGLGTVLTASMAILTAFLSGS